MELGSAASPVFARNTREHLTRDRGTALRYEHPHDVEIWSQSDCTEDANWCSAMPLAWYSHAQCCGWEHTNVSRSKHNREPVYTQRNRIYSPCENVDDFCKLLKAELRFAAGHQLCQSGIGQGTKSFYTRPAAQDGNVSALMCRAESLSRNNMSTPAAQQNLLIE